MKSTDFPKDGRRKYENGILTINLPSWRDFCSIIEELKAFPDYKKYVWRGQRRDDQPLWSTYDRKFRGMKENERKALLEEHLKRFSDTRHEVLGINKGEENDEIET